MARKAGNKWYIAAINGENIEKEIALDINFLKNKKGELIISGIADNDEPAFDIKSILIPASGKLNVTLKANDGFVMVIK